MEQEEENSRAAAPEITARRVKFSDCRKVDADQER
jgi:hypothetical protein